MPRWITLAEFDRLVDAMRDEQGPAMAEQLALRLLSLLRRRPVAESTRNTTERTS